MTPANVVLLINLALDLAERGAKALALVKRGNVTDAELDAIVSEDDAARDTLNDAIAHAREVEAAEDDGKPKFPQE